MLSQTVLRALRFAFPLTVPIAAGFLFIGLTYGLFTVSQGLPLGYPLIMCLLIFAGSMEFITVTLLFQPFDPVGAFIMALMVNGRHLFYAITMLGKYRGKGWKTPYLIYGMCDESFAVNVTTEVPENIDEGWFYFWVTLLNQAYWFMGVLIGSIAGSTLTFLPLKGIGFVPLQIGKMRYYGAGYYLGSPSHMRSRFLSDTGYGGYTFCVFTTLPLRGDCP